MKDRVKEVDYRGYRIAIEHDEDAQSPREWDNLGTIAYKHSRYKLGEETIDDPIDWLIGLLGMEDEEDVEYSYEYLRKLQDKAQDVMVIMPLYIYEHSGITISASSFGCRWDSGQFGYIYCTLENAIKNWMLPADSTWQTMMKDWHGEGHITLYDATTRVLQGEIKTFDQYLTGDVYGFNIYELDEDGEEGDSVDSYWGYFGDDGIEQLIDECKGTIDFTIKRNEEKEIERRKMMIKSHGSYLKTMIKNRVPFYIRLKCPIAR